MSGAAHDHDHDHPHDHDHGHSHDHGHGHGGPAARGFGRRVALAVALVVLGLAAAVLVTVRAGSATVITRFGDPVRVVTEPGLGVKLPAPIERAIEIDLRLHTTASGIHGVLTKDGLSLVVQAWVAWKVRGQEESIRHFLRAVQNRPEDAADQLRFLLGSSLETVTGRFELGDLLNTDPAKVRLAGYEIALADSLAGNADSLYGIEIVQVGIERLMLPESTVGATIGRMKAERETVAQTKKGEGTSQASRIRSEAQTKASLIRTQADEEASAIITAASAEAAKTYGDAYQADPQLFRFLRSLESLEQVVGPTTHLVLRTDAAPFRALVEAPAGVGIAGPGEPAPGTAAAP